jgi:hypothetical protein
MKSGSSRINYARQPVIEQHSIALSKLRDCACACYLGTYNRPWKRRQPHHANKRSENMAHYLLPKITGANHRVVAHPFSGRLPHVKPPIWVQWRCNAAVNNHNITNLNTHGHWNCSRRWKARSRNASVEQRAMLLIVTAYISCI